MKEILVVDDQEAIVNLLDQILTKAGYHVITAQDGAEAFCLAEKNSFDVIISDVNMPNLDGIRFVEKTRHLPKYKYTPILMVTTETSSSKKEMARHSGATGWLNKPIDADKTLSTVKKLLRG